MTADHLDENVVNVKILERSYRIKCPPEQVAELEEAARYLNEQMRKVRQSSNVMSTDRVAVVTALNLTNEFLRAKKQGGTELTTIKQKLVALNHTLDKALDTTPLES